VLQASTFQIQKYISKKVTFSFEGRGWGYLDVFQFHHPQISSILAQHKNKVFDFQQQQIQNLTLKQSCPHSFT